MGFFARLFGKKPALPADPPPLAELPATAQKATRLLPATTQPESPAPAPRAEPPPRAAPAAKLEPAADELADEVLGALDRALQGGGAIDGHLGPGEASSAEAEELFAHVAATYAEPVRGLIVELQRGTATRTWLEVARPALKSVEAGARSMGLALAADHMRALDEALAAAEATREESLVEPLAGTILARWAALAEVMPRAFALGAGPARGRDGVIIHALLAQLPEVGRVTLQKLYGAGLSTVEPLAAARPAELSAATGIPLRLAEQIIREVKRYREEREQKSSLDLAAFRERLGRLVGGLKAAHETFERSDGEEKRKARTARQNFLFQLSIVLAELGEVDYVKALERLPFEKRVASLEDYLGRLGGTRHG